MASTSLDKTLNLTNEGLITTVQGEGKYSGIPSIFIRLSGCNLRCQWENQDGSVTLCDTPFSSHYPEFNPCKLIDLLDKCRLSPVSHVVITGGEPFMQVNIDLLIEHLVLMDKHVTVETNGTIFRNTKASFISISPKLASSCKAGTKSFRSHNKLRINYNSLSQFTSFYPHQLKFVVNTTDDLEEIDEIVKNLKSEQDNFHPYSSIYLMPQGIISEELDKKLGWIIEEAKNRNWNVTDRLQIRAWGDLRGV